MTYGYNEDGSPITEDDLQSRYEERYRERQNAFKAEIGDDDLADEIEQEVLANYNVKHSDGRPELDSEINWERARKVVSKRRKFNPETESLLSHIARTDGISLKQAKANARKELKKTPSAYYDSPEAQLSINKK